MKIMTYDPKKGKKVYVGDFDNGIYTRKVKPSHYMYTLKAYGMSEDVVSILKFVKCVSIRLDTGTKILDSLFADWLEAPVKDYGHGKQRFLSINKMESI